MKLSIHSMLILLALLTSCQSSGEKPPRFYRSESNKVASFPFSDAVEADGFLFVSGQIGNLPGSRTLVEGGIEAETRQAFENITAILEASGYSLDDVIKCTVMLDDIGEWPEFNEVYKGYFRKNFPARSALGAEGLALGAKVEIECVAYRDE